MKTLICFFASISFLVAANANLPQPSVVDSNYHTGYIPDGFDTNDHVQMVGEGVYSNTCFRPASYDIKVNHAEKKVMLTPKAYKYDGMCLMMLVPYSQTIDLGILKAGRYEVIQKDESSASKLGDVAIRVAANSSADDYLYAPISQAFFQQANGKSKLMLTGEFSNTCWKYVETRVDVQKNVIVVQPVSEMEEGVACIDKVVPFQKEIVMNGVPKGRYLLHIRSTNAKAVNNLIDVQ